MKIKIKNESPWDFVDVADTALNLLAVCFGLMVILYGAVEGAKVLWLGA